MQIKFIAAFAQSRIRQGGWVQFLWYFVTLVLSIVLAPKPPQPRPAALEDFDIPTAEEDRPIPVLFGTVRITGPNVVWYGALSVKKIKQSSLFSSTTIGFKYHLGMQLAVCHGAIDALTKLESGDKVMWTGNVTANATIAIDEPELYGGNKREGGIFGQIDVLMGAPAQTVNAYLLSVQGTPTSAYRGVFTLAWKTGETSGPPGPFGSPTTVRLGYIGNTPYVKPWAIHARRILQGWHGGSAWYPEKAAIGTGMNPAHIIYEILTNPEWGQGSPTTTIDDVQFRSAADALFAENFGLNMMWNQPAKIDDFLAIVLDHIAAILAFDHVNGLYVLRLVRGDYDENILDVFDDSSIEDMTRFERRSWGETVNELTVGYTDPDTFKSTLITVQDNGNIRAQGVRIAEKINLPGIQNSDLIKVVAGRELGARSTPVARMEFKINRKFWDKGPGQVVKLTWPKEDVSEMVIRILETRGGTLERGMITVSALEDIYALAGFENVGPQPAPPPSPPPPPSPDDDGLIGLTVISATTSAPPVSNVADGDAYLIPLTPAATGAWAGHEGEITIADEETNTWTFLVPTEGMIVFVQDEGVHVQIHYGEAIDAPWTPAIPPLLEETNPDLVDDFLVIYGGTGPVYRKIHPENLISSAITVIDVDDANQTITPVDTLAFVDADVTDNTGGAVTIKVSPLTTKGDIYTRSSSAKARLPVGANSRVLAADSAQSLGLAWVLPPVGLPGSGARVYKNATQTIPTAILTALTWPLEDFDTENYHDTASNTSRLVAPRAGKYLVGATVKWDTNTSGTRAVYVVVNGVTATRLAGALNPAADGLVQNVSMALTLAAADYVEFYVLHDSGADRTVVNSEQIMAAFITLVGGLTVPRQVRGATWVRAVGAIGVPVNDVAVYVAKKAVIRGVSILTNGGAGHCVVDIWKDVLANYPPTVGDTITASAKPTIAGGVTYVDTTLTGWSTALAAGDVLIFHLDSVTVFKAIFVTLHLEEVE